MPAPINPNPGDGTGTVPPVAIPPAQPPAPTAEEILRKENEELKIKFGASTTENQVLAARLKAEEDARKELTKEPTDSELRTAFPDWDLYDDIQKGLARRTYGAERGSANASRIAQQLQEERAWSTSIELRISSDQTLQGKEQAFRDYAMKPQHKGISMEVLVPAFLQLQGAAAPAPITTPKPGLETGNGGPRTPEKPKTLSSEELNALRTSNYPAWEQYIKTHDIQIEE